MDDADIASAIEKGITKQAQLITSLSLAVIGGLLVLMLQIKTHNASNPQDMIEFRYACFFWLSLGGSGVAILVGFLIFGLLIETAPIFYRLKFKRQGSPNRILVISQLKSSGGCHLCNVCPS